MTTSTLVPPPARQRDHGHCLGEPTLDVAIAKVWRRIMTARDVACPWCAGTMRPRFSAGPLPVGARCDDCGASLS